MLNAIVVFAILCFPVAAAAQETMLVVQKADDSVGLYETSSGMAVSRIEVGKKPHEVALSADGKFAYVTNYGIDHYSEKAQGGHSIAVVDLKARRMVGEIDLAKYHRPHGIERGRSGKLYVTCEMPATLLVIDPQSKRIVRHVDLDQSLPHMVAVTPDERKAYTANLGSETLSVVALEGDKAVNQISIGGAPAGMAMADDGRRLYAVNGPGNALVAIDTRTDTVVGRLDLPGGPVRLLVLPGGERLLVSLAESGAVAEVDIASLRALRQLPVGHRPEGVAFDPAGRFGYVSVQDDAKVIKFSLRDWTSVLEVKTRAKPDPVVILGQP